MKSSLALECVYGGTGTVHSNPSTANHIYLSCACIFQSTSLAEPISPNCVSSVANVTDCEAAINHVQKANKVSIASFAVCIALSLVILVYIINVSLFTNVAQAIVSTFPAKVIRASSLVYVSTTVQAVFICLTTSTSAIAIVG